MFRCCRAAALLIGVSSSGLLAAQAPAKPATTDAAAPGQGGDIVVTARRREESAQKVPISVIALGGEALERRQVDQVQDLQRIAPGLTIDLVNNKPSTVQVGIRGQRANTISSTQDPPTAIYFGDALILPVQGLNSAFYDLQSVQVLKGPQGTLFGRNTTGGAVVITPARPIQRFEGYVRGRIGNRDTYGLESVLNAPVGERLAVRGSVKYEEHGGYQRYLDPRPRGRDPWEEHYIDGRLSTLWKPNDAISNYTIGYYSRDVNGAIGANLVAINPLGPAARYNGTGARAIYPNIYDDLLPGSGRDPNHVPSNIAQFDRTRSYGAINTTTWDTGPVTLKNIASYRHVRNTSRMNIAGSRAPILLAYQNARNRSFSEEAQASGKAFGDRFDWLVGFYYYDQKAYDLQSSPAFYGPPLPQTVSTFRTYAKNRSYAGYVSVDYKLTERLTASAGFRYSFDPREVSWRHLSADLWQDVGIPFVPSCLVRDAAGATLPVAACRINGDKTFREPTWNINLNYAPREGILAYFTQRRGYRSGGFNARAVTAPQRAAFSAETVMDYELGAKTEFALGAWRFRVNADVYRDDYEDLQRQVNVFVGGNTFVNTIVNAASAKVDGIELEIEARLTRELTLSATYAYTKPKYRSFPQFVGGVLRDFSDRDLAGVPRNAVTAAVEYQLPIEPDLGRVAATVNYSFTSSTAISDNYQSKSQLAFIYTPAQLALIPDGTVFRTPAYSLVDAGVTWTGIAKRPIDLSLYAKNLFDKRYPVNGSGLYDTLGVTVITYGRPRTFGAELTYHFD